jgi:DNA polymerase
MTAEEKTAAAGFLDLTADYLFDGYRRPHDRISFEDDAEARGAAGQVSSREVMQPAFPLKTAVQDAVQPVLPPENADSAGDVNSQGSPDSLEKVAEEVRQCGACRLCEKRTQGVSGEGVSAPLVMVIGEGPGADEDATGRPFVGKAGQLLDRMLASIGLSRQKNCFIANVVKCRPPQNRDPQPDEIIFCGRFLKRQIAILKPKVILCAGRIAAQTMLRTDTGIGKLRGRFELYRTEDAPGESDSNTVGDSFAVGNSFAIDDSITADNSGGGIPLLVTYHPSALLRNEDYKRPAWEDLKMLRARLIEIDSNYARETAE